ncbi:DAK2 domain-containing protein [Sanguibacter sp. 25GB23B1]|uniref:DAK2 domain-containing protein n=1 Tax=unclassified Sanguibacter TaxID=2645534 RepID=UPI0032AFA507
MAEVGTAHGTLTADALRAWVRGAAELLTLARPVIDRANVFPVADADTGTNMWLTLGEGRENVDALSADADVDAVLHALAEGALLGARGNSGVILSEYLRGFAAGARGSHTGSAAATVVAALREGARCAHAAVGQPRQGTILSAAAGAAHAAQGALDAGADLCRVVQDARGGAQDALRRSADDLDVLREAGVLDAGAYGLVLVLDALCRALGGDGPVSEGQGRIAPMTVLTTLSVEPSGSDADEVVAACAHEQVGRPVGAGVDGEFEVMYVVEHSTDGSGTSEVSLSAVAGLLRDELRHIGDSVAVVGGPTGQDRDGTSHGLWQVHVHTDRPLEALRAGQPWTQRQVVVRSLEHQVSSAAHEQEESPGPAALGIVACTASPGLVTELARAGAVVVLRESVPVAANDVRRAVEETGAREVLLLPADAATREAARTWVSDAGAMPAAGQDRVRLHVLESASDLQVVAAMARWATVPPAPDRAEPAHLVEMLGAAVGSVRSTAVQDADPANVCAALALLLSPDHGSVTVLTVLVDDAVPDEVTDAVVGAAERLAPGIDVVALASGRRSGTVVLGVERE